MISRMKDILQENQSLSLIVSSDGTEVLSQAQIDYLNSLLSSVIEMIEKDYIF